MKESRKWRSSLEIKRLTALSLIAIAVLTSSPSPAQDEPPVSPEEESIEFVEPPPPPDLSDDVPDEDQDRNLAFDEDAPPPPPAGDSAQPAPPSPPASNQVGSPSIQPSPAAPAPASPARRESTKSGTSVSSGNGNQGSKSKTAGKSNGKAGKSTADAAGSRKIQSLDFKDAPIEEVIRAISQLTGKNFILDPAVNGRISIMAPTAVTVDEAYRAFLSALAINGYTVVPSGKFLKILPARTAQRDSIETFATREAPSSDQMITRIIKLDHLSVADVNRYMRTLVSKDGDLIGYEPTNSLIITDYGSNIRRILKILSELDKPGFEERLAVIPIRYAKAKDMAGMIEKIIEKAKPRAFPELASVASLSAVSHR